MLLVGEWLSWLSRMWLLTVGAFDEVTGVIDIEEKMLLESTGDLINPLSGLMA